MEGNEHIPQICKGGTDGWSVFLQCSFEAWNLIANEAFAVKISKQLRLLWESFVQIMKIYRKSGLTSSILGCFFLFIFRSESESWIVPIIETDARNMFLLDDSMIQKVMKHTAMFPWHVLWLAMRFRVVSVLTLTGLCAYLASFVLLVFGQ